MIPTQATNLLEAIERAGRDAGDRGISIYDGRGRRAERRSYAEIAAALRIAASRHRADGLRPGDRLLVALATGWDWIDAWLGALVAGATPAALAPPGAMGSNESFLRKLGLLSERLGVRRVHVPPAVADALIDADAGRWSGSVRTPESFAALAADPSFRPEAPPPEALAFLQFTSGSTGIPRAVRISHRAVLHNNAASDAAIGAPFGARAGDWASGMVSWLPLHHDMGLVGGLFLSFHLQHELHLFNPATFLARPLTWLQALGREACTFAPAPNFGYQLCVERVGPEQLAGIDLSGWRSAMTGAEMVRVSTFERFAERLAPTGFRPERVVPCYGLAEGTLAVTFDQRGQGIRTGEARSGQAAGEASDAVVSVGAPIADTELRVIAPDGSALEDGAVGQVIVRGPGLFDGYDGDPQATAECLQQGWLHTGDLGFIDDGELYLTGRIKDVLILRGHNVMPHELEWHAEAVAGGGGSLRCGAIAVEAGEQGEQAVLVMETTERDPDKLAMMEREIRNRIGRDQGIVPADVAFVRRGKIPKTTSGKVQRRELRRLYLDRRIERLDVGERTVHG